MSRRVLGLLLSVFVLALLIVLPGAAVAKPAGSHRADALLVTYRAGATAAEKAGARARASAKAGRQIVKEGSGRPGVELVQLPAGADLGAAQRRLAADPHVLTVEPDWKVTKAATSNDPGYTNGSLWGTYGDASTPANGYGSQASEAWAAGNVGSDDVYVGVIDEGVDVWHPDLAPNMWVNPFDRVDGVDNDGNGYIDDVNGWDFYYGNRTVYDSPTYDSHGTHVAGTIGAAGGNGIGIAGVAWNVTMISAKFLGPDGGYLSDAVRAIDYFIDLKMRHGVNIVALNNSWGGGGYSSTLASAIERANAAGIVFVAAAGNSALNNDQYPHYPSSYANSNIISVASVTSSGGRSSFSNYGATSVDIGAPGSGILSTLPGNTYGAYDGTSMATPHVSGAVALYAAAHPAATVAELRNAIVSTAVPTASLSGSTVTGARLDASSFVAPAPTPTPTPEPTPEPAPAPNQPPTATYAWQCTNLTCTFNATASDPDGTIAAYRWSFGDGTYGSGQTISHTFPVAGKYTVTLTVTDDDGAEFSHINFPSVTAPAPTITLTARGYLSSGYHRVELLWKGATTSKVDLWRGTKRITTTSNDGRHIDQLSTKGAATYSYKVCNASSSTVCSATVTVKFT